MENDRTEIHTETDEARAGSTPHVVRWILGISLLAAIVLLSIVWITGAATQDESEQNVTVTATEGDRSDIEGTDSIVDEGFDELDAPDAGDTDQVAQPVVEN